MSIAATLRAPGTRTVASACEAAARVPWFGPTGPDVLAYAANLLPEVVGMVAPVCTGSLHTAMFETLCRLRVGKDRYYRLRLADDARDLLAAYLVAVGAAVPEPEVSATVRGWVVFQDTLGVQLALAGAAGYWRVVLMAALWDAEGDG